MAQGNLPYIHGFSNLEQERLLQQAEFMESTLYRDVDFSQCREILEVGCGIGAQSEIMLRRFPRLKIHGIDMNDAQLATLAKRVEGGVLDGKRFVFEKMNGAEMSFEGHRFDGAFLCWILEHVKNPHYVLSEVKRVLRPSSKVVITEVMNASFFLDPYSPNTWKYWMAFNDYQYDHAGDPFVGAKLGNLLLSQGFQNIQTKVITLHYDNREPEKRRVALEDWSQLLLSASDALLKESLVTEEIVKGMKDELRQVSRDPSAVFFLSFVQASATS